MGINWAEYDLKDMNKAQAKQREGLGVNKCSELNNFDFN
jgi:hypothetical protein